MNFHVFTEYLKYRWKAKSRHGVHSPFVYRFIEDCLLQPGALQQKIRAYFKELSIISADVLQYQQMAASKPAKDTMIIVQNIHRSATHTQAWERMVNDKEILLSIDLYTIGLLFFKDEFKEKQHFILKV